MESSLNGNGKSWYYNNLANFITSVRLICTCCIIVLGVWHPEIIMVMFVLVVIAAVSDLLDGKIARSKKIISGFGGFLDRIADKLFICSMIVIIIWRYWPAKGLHLICKVITEGIGGAIILLEFILISSSAIGIMRGLSISSNQWGKNKMALESCAVIFWFFALAMAQYMVVDFFVAVVVVDVYLALAVFYAVKSLGGYYQVFTAGLKK